VLVLDLKLALPAQRISLGLLLLCDVGFVLSCDALVQFLKLSQEVVFLFF